MTPELNGGEGAGSSGRGAAMGSGEALEPAYGERGGLAPMKWQETEVRMAVMAYRRWT
jgi:hypothetical protein